MFSELVNNLNKLHRDDKLIQEILKGFSAILNDLLSDLSKIQKNYWFDTLDNDLGIPMMCELLDLILRKELTINEKRSIIESRWKNNGHLSEKHFKKIVSNWHNGEIEVTMTDTINIKFISIGGIPSALDEIKDEFTRAKPAFLTINYIFSYLYWDLWDSWNLTWDEFENLNLTWDQLETTIFKPII